MLNSNGPCWPHLVTLQIRKYGHALGLQFLVCLPKLSPQNFGFFFWLFSPPLWCDCSLTSRVWQTDRQTDSHTHTLHAYRHNICSYALPFTFHALFTTTFQASCKPNSSILWPVAEGPGFQSCRLDNPTHAQKLTGAGKNTIKNFRKITG